MRRLMACLLVVFLSLSAAMTRPVFAQVAFGVPERSALGTAVNPGDVYGHASFELIPVGGVPMGDLLSRFVQSVVESQYGKREGSYILTLEVTQAQDGRVLTVQPLVSVTVSRSGFLFWTTSSDVSQSIAFTGTLLRTGAINRTNNDVRVSLKSYYKRSTTFDIESFDVMSGLISDLGVLTALDTVGISSGVLARVKELLTKSLSNSDALTEHFSFEMSFAHLGSVDNRRTRELVVPVNFRVGPGVQSFVTKIRTWSEPSRFSYSVERKRFIEPKPWVILNQSSIQTADASIAIPEFAMQSGPENIRSYLNAIIGTGTVGTGVTGFQVCTALLSYYSRYLSNRDALALLWATLSEHRDGFKKIGAKECVMGRRADFEALGLTTDTLVEFFS
jgi:hypothetical protein